MWKEKKLVCSPRLVYSAIVPIQLPLLPAELVEVLDLGFPGFEE